MDEWDVLAEDDPKTAEHYNSNIVGKLELKPKSTASIADQLAFRVPEVRKNLYAYIATLKKIDDWFVRSSEVDLDKRWIDADEDGKLLTELTKELEQIVRAL